jgi:DNA-binding protein Fis
MTNKTSINFGLNESVRTHLKLFLQEYQSDLCSSNLHALVINEIEKILIEEVLFHEEYNKKKAASTLGINRNTLQRKIISLGIEFDALLKNGKKNPD